MTTSLAQQWAHLSPEARQEGLQSLAPATRAMLPYLWPFWARPAQLPPPGDWYAWIIMAGRGFGKMLADTTAIPTPEGWTTMGDIQVGDTVFDEAGRPCLVTAKFSPLVNTQYRITFSDGSTLEACADHQWVTWTHAERKAFLRSPYEDTTRFPENWPTWRLKRLLGRSLKRAAVEHAIDLAAGGMSTRAIGRTLGISKESLARHLRAGRYLQRHPVIHQDAPGPQIRTTQDIAHTLTYGKRGDLSHCIPCCGALQLQERDLPVPPYTLGVWLGDGNTADGGITCHEDDQWHIINQLGNDGIEARRSARDSQRILTTGLSPLLRQAGILRNKHVPACYLRASARQRLALLRGLMDTDGNIENGSTVAFVNTNRHLIDAVRELIRSLGMKGTISTGIGKCNGKIGKRYWRVLVTPTINPFTLPRKAKAIVLGGAQSLRNHHRMIVAVDPIDSVPMSCITVDSLNSMYLAGEAMIPTHNTRPGAHWTIDKAHHYPGCRLALVAETVGDVRDVMVEGATGVLACSPPAFRPHYEPSKRRLTWPNGSMATTYSSEIPEQLRGPQHAFAWLDEAAKFRHLQDTWANLELGLRLGQHPQVLVTTTPRPIPWLIKLLADPQTVKTGGATYENLANLAPGFAQRILSTYEGTRLGRQELHAEILEDFEGALWTRAILEQTRVTRVPAMQRIVVGVDPGTDAGIIVAGLGEDGQGYVLDDLSLTGSPIEWARQAVSGYHRHSANLIVAEANHGHEMVRTTLHTVDALVPVKTVWASQGKYARAEPVSALYHQGRVHHVGMFAALEDELCTWAPGEGLPSPDKLDALVWAIHALMLTGQAQRDDEALPIALGEGSQWAI